MALLQARHQSARVRRGATLLIAILATTFTTSCSGAEKSSESTCEAAERAAYVRLEKAATRALTDVEHTFRRYSGCEDKGAAAAAVIADINLWSERRQAGSHLASMAWTKVRGSMDFRSPDGTYLARPMIATEPSAEAHVAIYFTES